MNHPKTLIKFFVWPAIFLFVLVLGLYVRLYPLRAHVWSDTTQQATMLVLTKLKSILTEQINSQLPGMPEAQRNALIEAKFAQTLHNDAAMVRKTIAEASQNLRQASNEHTDRVYLQEADGYYYYDLTKNIATTGNIASQFKGSKFLNEKMAAPFGFWQPINLHPYVGFFIYKVISIFQPNIELVNALCWTGPVLSALALGAFVLLCFILRLSPIAALIGSAYFYLAPIFVKRSTFAWYDDDSYNLLFPLLILCAVFQALKSLNFRRDGVIYGSLTSLLFATYALFWHGWGYTFAVIIASGILILAAHCFMNQKFKPHTLTKENNKLLPPIEPRLLIFFATILCVTAVLVSIMFGVSGLLTIFGEGLRDLKKLTVNQLSMWPNLFVAVGELKRSSLKEIIAMTGNPLSFWGAFAGAVISGYHAFQHRDRIKIYQLIILCVLLAGDIKITLGAERFILLCLIPLSILFTIGISSIIDLTQEFFPSSKVKRGRLTVAEFIIGIIFVIIAIYFPVRSINNQIGGLLSTIFNPTWEAALLDIKKKTPPDSIVTTWWPPGHFIKAVSERRVTFDGATLNKNKEAYWIANILLTADEQKAAGILRMLNTHAADSVDYLETQGMKTSEAVLLLHHILAQNKKDASEFLKRMLPAPTVEKVLSMTHLPPPPSYFLIYSELMEKNIGLEFVGKWNFKAIENLNSNPEALKKIPPASSPEFFEFLWSTMGGPYKYSEALISVAQNGSILEFDQGLTVDLAAMTASVNSAKFGNGIPRSIIYSDGKKVLEKTFPNSSLSYSAVLFKENNRYYCRFMDQELANSMLVKFFIFKGVGLEYFKPLSLNSDLTGRDEVDVFELIREKL